MAPSKSWCHKFEVGKEVPAQMVMFMGSKRSIGIPVWTWLLEANDHSVMSMRTFTSRVDHQAFRIYLTGARKIPWNGLRFMKPFGVGIRQRCCQEIFTSWREKRYQHADPWQHGRQSFVAGHWRSRRRSSYDCNGSSRFGKAECRIHITGAVATYKYWYCDWCIIIITCQTMYDRA